MIIYRNDGAWGSGKGSRLTSTEVDNNFYDHDQRIEAIEEAPPSARGIESIAVDESGVILTITYTDATTDEFPLPVLNVRPAGEWENDHTYFYGDVITVNALGTFIVLVGHTTPSSPEEFDPDAVDEEDNPLYLLLFPYPDITTAARFRGEYTGSFVYLTNDIFVHAEYGLFAVLQDHTSASTLDQFAEIGGNPLYQKLAGPHFSPPDTVSTTTYEVSLDDIGKYLRCTHGSGCAVSFPDLEFPVGAEIHFRQAVSGSVSFIEAGTDVVLNPQRDGFDTSTPWVGATVTAKYLGGAEWDLIGPHGDELTI